MSSVNALGLKRYIPAPIRQEIRTRSKFGCVICRSAIAQYEHIEPEWADATSHDPAKMCLLCGRCHDKVTRGHIAKSTVKQCYEDIQNSTKAKSPFEEFDLNSHEITVILGASTFHGAKTLIELDGEAVLAIEPPENGSSFPTLSGVFTDHNGNLLLRIERNIWTGGTNIWDVEVEGAQITLRLQKGRIALRLRVLPPNTIIIETLDMRIGSGHLILKHDQLTVGRITPEAEYYISFDQLQCRGAKTGVQVSSQSTPPPTFHGLSMAGGQGVELLGTGVKVAVGAGQMHILGLGIELATKQQTLNCRWDLTSSMQGTIKVSPPRI